MLQFVLCGIEMVLSIDTELGIGIEVEILVSRQAYCAQLLDFNMYIYMYVCLTAV